MSIKAIRTFVIALGFLAGSSLLAQSENQAADPLGLKGYDPVAYFTEGKPTHGKETHESTWDGVRYRFASERHQVVFSEDPGKFTPRFAGSCAMAMTRGVKVQADPEAWAIIDGKLFVFASLGGRQKFLADPGANLSLANQSWAAH